MAKHCKKEIKYIYEADKTFKLKDRQDHDGHHYETKDKHVTHNTALKTNTGVKLTLQKQG